MKTVLHIGPCNSKGGIATVIDNMMDNPPKGWKVEKIDTHGQSAKEKIKNWFRARRTIKEKFLSEEICLAHIHVTHSISWWRKRDLMRVCEKIGLPSVIQIHSGKFDSFCEGVAGFSVKRRLNRPNRRVIVLENRWKELLRRWLPKNTEVVNNFSRPLAVRRNHSPDGTIKLLLLSRPSPVKGKNFALDIVRYLTSKGSRVSLKISGGNKNESLVDNPEGQITCLGWVSEQEKSELIKSADFLLSPSIYEGSSMSVIESMVSGLPCVVSDASSETVGDNYSVVSDFSPEKWGQRILELSSPKEYEKIVEKTILNSEKYAVAPNVMKIGRIYADLVPTQP